MAGKFNKYIKEETSHPTRFYSKQQEDYVAKTLEGKRTANSGATAFGGKSDVNISNLISIECKTKMTSSDSILLKKEWFEKLKRETAFDGREHSALAFNFGPNEEMHYVIDEYLFKTLLEYLKQNN